MSDADLYQRFLEGKIRFEHACGFDIDPDAAMEKAETP